MRVRTNTQLLAGIRCPKCNETQRFALQMTMNVVMEDDGWDSMGRQPEPDVFPGRVIDPEDGLHDEDPIMCFNGTCRHLGTVGEFRAGW